ncbi:Hypothetical predicted protein [Drosophila guanche]|uniref:Uncharacterized protein n=1 Tax=Drosophila guanche TaxID=7266 RepID=A0A3B0J642_DROGU|nr:Hypothetical predicted protein [Drosophila guanche]
MSNNCRSIGGLPVGKLLLATSKTAASMPRFNLQLRNSCTDHQPLVKAFWERRIVGGALVRPNVPAPRIHLAIKQPHRGPLDSQMEWTEFFERQQQEAKTAEELQGKRRKWRATLFMELY